VGSTGSAPGNSGCRSCARAAWSDQPLRERILVTDHWRVAHAFDTSLPGWLVVLPHEHVESLAELSPEAALELGPMLRDLSRALAVVTGCTKAYVMFLAEAEGFAHVHLHVVPRMPDQPAEERGPRIFARLGRPEGEQVPAADMEQLAQRLAAELRTSSSDG
jgi:diadenosine tetraphosphate (Ap4A) HIT family hydrolase